MRWRSSVFFSPFNRCLAREPVVLASSCRRFRWPCVVSCRFFTERLNVLIPDEHRRQECAFNGKAKVLWEELRWDPQDSGRDVRCGHLCRFLIWWSIFFLNFIPFFFGEWWGSPFVNGDAVLGRQKNGDRFHKETVYLSLSGGFKHFWFIFTPIWGRKMNPFWLSSIFFPWVGSTTNSAAMNWLRWRTSSCDISRCGWPSSEVRVWDWVCKEKVVVPHVLKPLLGWILGPWFFKKNVSTDYTDMYNFD